MSDKENNLVAIVGWHEGSAGQIHSWFEKVTGYKVVCFVHTEDTEPAIVKIPRQVRQFSYPENLMFKGLPLVCAKNWTQVLREKGITKVLITTPAPSERAVQINEAKQAKLELLNAIHPTAIIMEESHMGKNIIMHARTFLGYRAELSDGVIVNTGSQVDHHCAVKECVTIDPGVILAGNVHIEPRCTIHTGVVVRNKITIGENVIVGAGSVVINNLSPNQTVVGVPAATLHKK